MSCDPAFSLGRLSSSSMETEFFWNEGICIPNGAKLAAYLLALITSSLLLLGLIKNLVLVCRGMASWSLTRDTLIILGFCLVEIALGGVFLAGITGRIKYAFLMTSLIANCALRFLETRDWFLVTSKTLSRRAVQTSWINKSLKVIFPLFLALTICFIISFWVVGPVVTFEDKRTLNLLMGVGWTALGVVLFASVPLVVHFSIKLRALILPSLELHQNEKELQAIYDMVKRANFIVCGMAPVLVVLILIPVVERFTALTPEMGIPYFFYFHFFFFNVLKYLSVLSAMRKVVEQASRPGTLRSKGSSSSKKEEKEEITINELSKERGHGYV